MHITYEPVFHVRMMQIDIAIFGKWLLRGAWDQLSNIITEAIFNFQRNKSPASWGFLTESGFFIVYFLYLYSPNWNIFQLGQ